MKEVWGNSLLRMSPNHCKRPQNQNISKITGETEEEGEHNKTIKANKN